MLYVNINILHVDINESHVNKIMLHVDLMYLANMSPQTNVYWIVVFLLHRKQSFRSARFDVGKSSYHRSKKRVAWTLVNASMPQVIQWPTWNKIVETSNDFSDISGLLNVLGAVDGSHIRIKAPTENSNAYYNRKNYHSLVLQASDASLRFT